MVDLISRLAAAGLTSVLAAGALGGAAVAAESAELTSTEVSEIGTPGVLDVALVATLTSPASADPLIDAATLATLTGPEGVLTSQLDALIDRPVTIGIDPRILASIRILGSSAPVEALDWLDRLESASNDTFLLGYGDADPAVLAAVGAASVASPTGLSTLADQGDFGAADQPEPTASAEPDPDGPPLPDDADLVAWESELELAWPLAGTVTADGLAGLDDAGVTQMLVSSSQIPGYPGTTVHLRGTGIDALVTDEALSASADDLATATAGVDATTSEPERELRRTLRERTSSGVESAIIELGRTHAPTALDVDAVIEAVESANADIIDLTDLSEVEPTASRLRSPEADPAARTAVLSRVATENRRMQRFSSVASTPDLLAVPSRVRLAVLAGIGWQHSLAEWETVASEVIATSSDQRRAVQIAPGSDLLVLSNSTGIPVSVSNGLDVPVTVYVRARSLRSSLQVDRGVTEVVIEPDSQARVYVPATAVSNGTVPVELSLTSSTGISVGMKQSLSVELQAQWETVGLILGGLVVVIFAVGIARNILRRRRNPDDDEEDPAAFVEPEKLEQDD